MKRARVHELMHPRKLDADDQLSEKTGEYHIFIIMFQEKNEKILIKMYMNTFRMLF